MTEAEWLQSPKPYPMLGFLHGKMDARRMRLFACACCRQVWPVLRDARSRKAVRKLEEFADDLANTRLRRDAYNIANAAYSAMPYGRDGISAAACTAVCATYPDPFVCVLGNFDAALSESRGMNTAAIQQLEADLLRDIFGDLFRPITFASEWRTETTVLLARRMYEKCDFSAMPILADALQDAGCDNDEVLNHCRADRVHARGCWVVDAVLGKR